MGSLTLYPGDGTRLTQLLSLSQSWTVRDRLYLNDLGPEDWTELSRTLDTLDSHKHKPLYRHILGVLL